MDKQCRICGKPMTLFYRDREFRGQILKNIGAYECECGEIVYTSEQAKYIERQLRGERQK